MRIQILTLAVLVAILGMALTGRAVCSTSRVALLAPVDFAPVMVAPGEQDVTPTYLVPPGDLERTPRDYLRVRASVESDGVASAKLIIIDLLGREYGTEAVTIGAGTPVELVTEARRPDGSPISMIRTVRLDVTGQPVRCTRLLFECAAEYLPEPDVVVEGPLDETSIQKALDALGPDGGVVYIPPGEYTINNTVTIPVDNVSIYGAGKATLLQGVHMDGTPLLRAEGRQNVRICRLHLRSLPLETFRGYNDQRYAEKPEDVGRPSLRSCGIHIFGCRRVRLDHCEIERFGYGGVLIRDSSELCFDHSFYHENFCYGLGYGIVPCATEECYIEDINFENHRHGTAGGGGTQASYTTRFNRYVKDISAVPETGWKQVTSHEIDVHSGCRWLYAHDNWVEMKNASMSAGACLRGNSGWVWNNVFTNASHGVLVVGDSTDVWTWDNECHSVTNPNSSSATGQVYFDHKPENFAPIAYPSAFNTRGWWPGVRADGAYDDADPEGQFPGPATGLQLEVVAVE